MRFGWQWSSKQGAERLENRDMCGLYCSENYTFGIVVDASSKGKSGIQFTETWVSELLRTLPNELPTQAQVIAAMHHAQRLLAQARLFCERACYAALVLPHRADITPTAFICGDCSIGISVPEYGGIEWLSRSQTLASYCDKLLGNGIVVSTNIVTCTLNARRFSPPISLELPINATGKWILATDGFTNGRNRVSENNADDASYLILGMHIPIVCETDRANYCLAGGFSK